MQCIQIEEILKSLTNCAITDEGSRIATHCLYPSFEPVNVFVSGIGEGFRVHDGGGAVKSAWDHGRDINSVKSAIKKQASIYDLMIVDDALVASVPNGDWLLSAIISVANASAAAAQSSVERGASISEESLKDRIEAILRKIVEPNRIAKDYQVSGRSGKQYGFEFAVRRPNNRWLLIDSVVPHHTSIAAKYVAFSDTKEEDENTEGRFAVYDRDLEDEDAALLQQVTSLVPFGFLPTGLKSEVRN